MERLERIPEGGSPEQVFELTMSECLEATIQFDVGSESGVAAAIGWAELDERFAVGECLWIYWL